MLTWRFFFFFQNVIQRLIFFPFVPSCLTNKNSVLRLFPTETTAKCFHIPPLYNCIMDTTNDFAKVNCGYNVELPNSIRIHAHKWEMNQRHSQNLFTLSLLSLHHSKILQFEKVIGNLYLTFRNC